MASQCFLPLAHDSRPAAGGARARARTPPRAFTLSSRVLQALHMVLARVLRVAAAVTRLPLALGLGGLRPGGGGQAPRGRRGRRTQAAPGLVRPPRAARAAAGPSGPARPPRAPVQEFQHAHSPQPGAGAAPRAARGARSDRLEFWGRAARPTKPRLRPVPTTKQLATTTHPLHHPLPPLHPPRSLVEPPSPLPLPTNPTMAEASPLAQRENSVRMFGPKTPGRAGREKVGAPAAAAARGSALAPRVVDSAAGPRRAPAGPQGPRPWARAGDQGRPGPAAAGFRRARPPRLQRAPGRRARPPCARPTARLGRPGLCGSPRAPPPPAPH